MNTSDLQILIILICVVLVPTFVAVVTTVTTVALLIHKKVKIKFNLKQEEYLQNERKFCLKLFRNAIAKKDMRVAKKTMKQNWKYCPHRREQGKLCEYRRCYKCVYLTDLQDEDHNQHNEG